MSKTFTIKKYSRRGLISFTTGTIKSLVKALNDSVDETQGSCYYQDYYEDWTGKEIESNTP